jgi:hypothetical protein
MRNRAVGKERWKSKAFWKRSVALFCVWLLFAFSRRTVHFVAQP